MWERFEEAGLDRGFSTFADLKAALASVSNSRLAESTKAGSISHCDFPGPPMSTIRDQKEERRKQKLASVRRQMKNGSLVIRQMTPEERKAFPLGSRPCARDRSDARRAVSLRLGPEPAGYCAGDVAGERGVCAAHLRVA